MTQFLRVKNWELFQQYKDRDPKWIKVYRSLLDDYDFNCLTEVQQCHLQKIWLLAAKIDNKIPADPVWVGRRINAKSKVQLKQLCTKGFLEPYNGVHMCTDMYLETETETETDKRNKESRPRKRGSRLSKDWKPNKKLLAWATAKRPDLNIVDTIESFTDYWISKTGASATKLDWDATFRNWIRNERKRPALTKLPLADDQLADYATKNNLPAPRPGESSRQYRARLSDALEASSAT
jgi:hypothetical protein